MTALVALFGALVAGLGSVGAASPARLLDWVDAIWRSGRAVPLAVGIRLVLGVVLLLAAPQTRFPGTVAALGWIALAAAVAIPVIGAARLQRFVGWWLARPPGFVRAWGAVAVLFGGFLVYAAL